MSLSHRDRGYEAGPESETLPEAKVRHTSRTFTVVKVSTSGRWGTRTLDLSRVKAAL